MKTCYVDDEHWGIADLVQLEEFGIYKNVCILTRVSIRDEFRGHGYGRALLKRILHDADEEGITIFLEVIPSGPLDFDQLQAWYARHGFEIHPDLNRPGPTKPVMWRRPKREGTETQWL